MPRRATTAARLITALRASLSSPNTSTSQSARFRRGVWWRPHCGKLIRPGPARREGVAQSGPPIRRSGSCTSTFRRNKRHRRVDDNLAFDGAFDVFRSSDCDCQKAQRARRCRRASRADIVVADNAVAEFRGDPQGFITRARTDDDLVAGRRPGFGETRTESPVPPMIARTGFVASDISPPRLDPDAASRKSNRQQSLRAPTAPAPQLIPLLG